MTHLYIYKQRVALTGRNTTGPPPLVNYVAYVPRYIRRWQTTDDDDRRQMTPTNDDRHRRQLLGWSSSYTMC